MLLRNDPVVRRLDALMDSVLHSTMMDGAHGLRFLSERPDTPSEIRKLEEDGRFVLELPLPGLSAEDVTLDLTGRKLTVRAERAVTVPEGYTPLRRERSGWSFDQTWVLSDRLDPESVEASFSDGVLRIAATQLPEPQARRIEVNGQERDDTHVIETTEKVTETTENLIENTDKEKK